MAGNLFLGFPVPREVGIAVEEAAEAYCRAHDGSDGVEFVPLEKAHMTFLFLGKATQGRLEQGESAVERCSLSLRAASVSIWNLNTFGSRVLKYPVSFERTSDESAFKDARSRIALLLGLRDSSWSPHVTVAKGKIHRNWSEALPRPIRFDLDRVQLYLTTEKGYEVVEQHDLA